MTETLQKDGITVKYIVPYISILIIFCILTLGSDFSAKSAIGFRINPSLSPLLIGLLGTGGFLASIALQNLVPRDWREVIVFWRLNNRLPGFRAFSQVMKNDHRINSQRIAALGGGADLPEKKQNDLWYQWYRSLQDEPSVWYVGRLYLAFRDLAAVILLTSPIPLISWIISDREIVWAYILSAFVGISYFIAVAVARNKSKELVTNVIAMKSGVGDPEPRILFP